MNIAAFLDEALCSLVPRYRCFGGTVYQTERHLVQIHQMVYELKLLNRI
jgi:hypothetical protein